MTKHRAERLIKRLPPETLCAVGDHIVRRMYQRSAGGLTFGLDWRTTRICFPRLVDLFGRLKTEYNARKGAGNGK